jgi:hypothetical protein
LIPDNREKYRDFSDFGIEVPTENPYIALNSGHLSHRNVLIVAMANKLARIAWAVLSSGEEYQPCAPARAAA